MYNRTVQVKLAPLSLRTTLHSRFTALRSGNITKDMRFSSCRASTQIAPVGRNFSYPQTFNEIASPPYK